jgi:hypothetical protein
VAGGEREEERTARLCVWMDGHTCVWSTTTEAGVEEGLKGDKNQRYIAIIKEAGE